MKPFRLSMTLTAAAVALLVPVAGPALAQDSSLTVSGSGAQANPDPGEDGATVEGTFSFDATAGTITYTVSAAGNADPVVAAHLHEAAAGAAGPVVVPLDTAAVLAGTEATATATPALVAEIVANPANYYLNVHSAGFPNGFARAQLAGDGSNESAPSSVPAGDGSSANDSALLGTVLVAAGAAAVAAVVVRRRRSGLTD